jgi:hypothetical protein
MVKESPVFEGVGGDGFCKELHNLKPLMDAMMAGR